MAGALSLWERMITLHGAAASGARRQDIHWESRRLRPTFAKSFLDTRNPLLQRDLRRGDR